MSRLCAYGPSVLLTATTDGFNMARVADKQILKERLFKDQLWEAGGFGVKTNLRAAIRIGGED